MCSTQHNITSNSLHRFQMYIMGNILLESLCKVSNTLELSFNSTWVLVGSWLFCLQNLPCLVSLWCMRGGSVEVWTKNILYQFMEGQTHFSTSWHAKMSLTLHEPIYNVLCSNLHTTSTHAPKTYQTWKVLYSKQPTRYQKSCWIKG